MSEIKIYKNNNLSIKYAVIGIGKKPLIMIPGISLKPVVDSASFIEEAFSIFNEKYTIYLIDRKENIEQGYTIDDMAKDTINLLDFLDIKNASFYGASQGGMITERIAFLRPDMVSKAVFASTAMYVDAAHKKVFESWIEKGKTLNPRLLNMDMWEKIYDENYLEKFKEIFDSIVSDATPYEMKKICILSEACINFDSRPYIDDVKCKSFVVGGAFDNVLGVKASKELAKALKGEIYIYENYGHALYDEAPDFKKIIYQFFEK